MFKLFRYLKPYWFQVVLLLLSIVIQTWFTLQLPALMADIVNEGVTAGNQDAIWQIGTKMLISAILTALGALSAGYFSAKVGTAFSRDLRKDFYKKVISFSITEIDKYSTASLITRTTNDISQVQETIVMMLSMMLRAPMMSIIAIIQAFNTAPSMTWIIALAIGILITLVVVVLSSVIKKFKLFQKLLDKITLLTRENLTGLRVIRAFNNESYEQKKFNTANTELTNTILFINKIMSLTSPLMNLVFNGICLLCIWVGVSLMTEDISYLGNMMAFMQYAIQVLMSFLVLTIFFLMLPRANVSAARINEVLGETPKIHWKKETIGIPDKPASVEFHHVNFSYGHAEEQALTDISFTAKAGETTAIIGSTGSGKSTTLAAIINEINETRRANIITIEDPVEFVHQDKKSLLSQREVGIDTESFGMALRQILRQAPDVILVGELRDVETMNIALSAAETGHLVFSTIHTSSASETMERIINMFPPEQRELLCLRLSKTLKGIVAQRLLKRIDKPGRMAAVEVLTATPTTVKLIEDGRSGALYDAIKEGKYYGMQTMNYNLDQFYKAGIISETDALANSGNESELKMMFRRTGKGVGSGNLEQDQAAQQNQNNPKGNQQTHYRNDQKVERNGINGNLIVEPQINGICADQNGQ